MRWALGRSRNMGLATDQYQINEYSVGIQQLENWLFQCVSPIGDSGTEYRRDIGQTEADSI